MGQMTRQHGEPSAAMGHRRMGRCGTQPALLWIPAHQSICCPTFVEMWRACNKGCDKWTLLVLLVAMQSKIGLPCAGGTGHCCVLVGQQTPSMRTAHSIAASTS